MSSRSSLQYRHYVLYLLLIVYIINFVDRQILALLMEPIKNELGLSDTQLGFMSGIAFAIFYTTLGIPIARLADRSHRVNIISVAITVWSGMTVLSGLAVNYWQLVLARIGVGVGEAGCTPPAHSLIADYFSKAERGKAITIYMMGGPIGVLVGFLIGGWVNELYGWRVAFIVLGLPGLVIALIVKLIIRDPRYTQGLKRHQGSVGNVPEQHSSEFTLFGTLAHLWRKAAFRRLMVAMSLVGLIGGGIGQWVPAFFIRSHQMSTGELGVWLSIMVGLTGAIAIYLGGTLTERLCGDDEAYKMRVIACGTALMLGSGAVFLLFPNAYVSLVFLGVGNMLYYFSSGPSFALMLSLAPPQMRAMASAITLLLINLVGLGLGPQLVGLISDLLSPLLGDDSLRVAMLVINIFVLFAAWNYWVIGRTVKEDIANDEANINNDLAVTDQQGC